MPRHGRRMRDGRCLLTRLVIFRSNRQLLVALACRKAQKHISRTRPCGRVPRIEERYRACLAEPCSQYGIHRPSRLLGMPLIGGRVATPWQHHIGDEGCALASRYDECDLRERLDPIDRRRYRARAGFVLVTLLALVSLLARRAPIAEKAKLIAVGMMGGFVYERMSGSRALRFRAKCP